MATGPNYGAERRVTSSTDKVAGTQSIQRAIDILHEVASCIDTHGLRLGELCARTGLSRPTLYRILACLEENRMLDRGATSRSYRLGPAVFHLGLAATQHHRLGDTCAFALDGLAANTGDTVFLTIRSGNDSVTIDRRVGTFPIQALSLNVGARRPLGDRRGQPRHSGGAPRGCRSAHAWSPRTRPGSGPYTDLDTAGLSMPWCAQGRQRGLCAQCRPCHRRGHRDRHPDPQRVR